MIALLKKLLENVESQLQTQKTSTGSSNQEIPAQMEKIEKTLSPEQEYLTLLRKKIDAQETIINEMGKNIKLLSESLANVVSIQNEIAKQVMFLTDTVGQVSEFVSGPVPDYKFFSGGEPDN